MSKFTRKVKKNMAKSNNILNTPLYTVEHAIKDNNHFLRCTDCSGIQNYAMIPYWDIITKGIDKKGFKENIMRGFGDTCVILSYRDDLREKYSEFNNRDQLFLMWAFGIYHNHLLNSAHTQEENKKCYESILKTLSEHNPAVTDWFKAYSETFLDMGGSIGWAPVAMEVAAA